MTLDLDRKVLTSRGSAQNHARFEYEFHGVE